MTNRSVMIAVLAFVELSQGGAAYSQAAVEKLSSFSHPVEIMPGQPRYVDGAIYSAERLNLPGPNVPSRIVRFDPATGAWAALSDWDRFDAGEPLLWSQTRILTKLPSDWRAERYRLMSRVTGEDLTDIQLKHDIFDITERDGELLMLQYDGAVTISRFDPEDMTFLGRVRLPSFRYGGRPIFHGDSILGPVRLTPCEPSKFCYAIQRVSLDGAVLSTVNLVSERTHASCYTETGIAVLSRDIAIVRIECQAFAIDAGASRILYRLPDETAMAQVAIGDKLIFVRNRSGYQRPDKTYVNPLLVFDSATGEQVATREDIPNGFMHANGDTLILWRTEAGPTKGTWKLVADTYRFDPARFRRMGPR